MLATPGALCRVRALANVLLCSKALVFCYLMPVVSFPPPFCLFLCVWTALHSARYRLCCSLVRSRSMLFSKLSLIDFSPGWILAEQAEAFMQRSDSAAFVIGSKIYVTGESNRTLDASKSSRILLSRSHCCQLAWRSGFCAIALTLSSS